MALRPTGCNCRVTGRKPIRTNVGGYVFRYTVRLVGDDELPAPHDWAIVKTDTAVWVALRESAICERVLEEAWAGYRHAVAEGVAPRLRLVS